MLSRPKAPQPIRLISQVFVGAVKSVGGDAESTIRIATERAKVKPKPARPTNGAEKAASA